MAGDRDESGTAIVGTLVGFTIMLVLLLFATQMVVRLYATSTLTSVANRAAEQVASSPVPAADTGAAESAARSQLGSFGASHTVFVWREADADQVVLQVTARSPEFIPGIPGWSRITRTVTVRTERFRS
ncbi:MAG TPA: hypothetical protein VG435_09775 [Acidimicrobiales bacterium]|nr:hypothetical protein [Acidimicrobiales bacterium]